MRKKWSQLTDSEKVARLTAGRQNQLEREQDALVEMAEPDWVKGERARMFLDLSGNCEAREIQ